MALNLKNKLGVLLTVLLICIALGVVSAFALTVTITKYQKVGNERVRDGTIVISETMTQATGVSLTPSNLNLTGITHIEVSPNAGFQFQYNYATQKLHVVGYTDSSGYATTWSEVTATPAFRVWGY